jgi:hypothetical protein
MLVFTLAFFLFSVGLRWYHTLSIVLIGAGLLSGMTFDLQFIGFATIIWLACWFVGGVALPSIGPILRWMRHNPVATAAVVVALIVIGAIL